MLLEEEDSPFDPDVPLSELLLDELLLWWDGVALALDLDLLLLEDGLALEDSVGVADELTEEDGDTLGSGVPNGVVEADALGAGLALALVDAAVAAGEAAVLVEAALPVL